MSILHICIYQGSETSGNTLAAGGGDEIVGGRRWRGMERVGRREGAMGMNLLEGEVWLVLALCGAGWMRSACSRISMWRHTLSRELQDRETVSIYFFFLHLYILPTAAATGKKSSRCKASVRHCVDWTSQCVYLTISTGGTRMERIKTSLTLFWLLVLQVEPDERASLLFVKEICPKLWNWYVSAVMFTDSPLTLKYKGL